MTVADGDDDDVIVCVCACVQMSRHNREVNHCGYLYTLNPNYKTGFILTLNLILAVFDVTDCQHVVCVCGVWFGLGLGLTLV